VQRYKIILTYANFLAEKFHLRYFTRRLRQPKSLMLPLNNEERQNRIIGIMDVFFSGGSYPPVKEEKNPPGTLRVSGEN